MWASDHVGGPEGLALYGENWVLVLAAQYNSAILSVLDVETGGLAFISFSVLGESNAREIFTQKSDFIRYEG